jgi:predicted helicase
VITRLDLKPAHAPVKAYYQALEQFSQLDVDHEMAVRSAFQNLLEKCGRQFHWTLVPEFPITRPKALPLKADGALVDEFRLRRGLWEAKDERDNLEKEAKRKIAAGYPTDNIIFQAPERAILFQNGLRQGLNEDISRPDNLVELLRHFLEFREPHHQEWEDAVAEFSERLPEIAAGAKQLIDEERKKNPAFVKNFDAFYGVCRQAINPNLAEEAVEKMLIQHLLTERIFRKIFGNPDFTRRNVIAQEIEKVITSLTSRHFNRDAFLHDLDRFYRAIELNAENASNYSEKQAFLNTVYERFFQGYSPKEADTHGIVYTPQAIVNFMVCSVQDILRKDFNRSLSDREVHILDPFVGTGNFIVRIMQEIKKTALPYKYENELHCNEIMLLPYYISSMNIEHAYLEATGEYRPFPGICLVDTFELAEPKQAQLGFMTEENTKRVARQKQSPIFVIIGNPPYNVGQAYDNDFNPNRSYAEIDKRIRETYAKDSRASSVSKLDDPYVKAIRWASDRLGQEGIVAFVSNSGFLHKLASDGMRKHLAQDFDKLYILDLGGNVRLNPHLSGTTHNVFGIQLGVSIEFLVRNRPARVNQTSSIYYASLVTDWRKEQKLDFLEKKGSYGAIEWTPINPDTHYSWLTSELKPEFDSFVPIGLKEVKSGKQTKSVFSLYSMGVNSARDAWVFNSSKSELEANVRRLIESYNAEVSRQTGNEGRRLAVKSDDSQIKWSSRLREVLASGRRCLYSDQNIRHALFRPYFKQLVYFDPILIHRRGRLQQVFPDINSESTNSSICLTGPGSEKPFMAIMTKLLPDLHLTGAGCGTQCFPFFSYDADGSNQRENITDWSLQCFRAQYHDISINKWNIFYYIYAVLHHPVYRKSYAANLRREFPRVPFAPDFWTFVRAGERLADLHLNYEQQPEYKLDQVEKPGEQLNLRVKKMRLTRDKAGVVYNEFLTLRGIPTETYEYSLGNRSALEWIVDQYQVTTDKRSGIDNDPNVADDPEYILRLIGQVTTVSLETNKIVRSLPELGI